MINLFQCSKQRLFIIFFSLIVSGNCFSTEIQNTTPPVPSEQLTVNNAIQIALANNPVSQEAQSFLIFNIKKAYFEALAAKQSLHYMKQIKEAALSSNLLGQQMVKAGNWGPLQLANEQVLYADTKIKVANAKLKFTQALRRLATLMKVQNSQEITLPERLPELPPEILSVKQLDKNNIKENFLIYSAKYEIAKIYRDEVIPNRKLISKENRLLYNGMLMSPFELLKDTREQMTSIQDYISALKDFWIADAALALPTKISPDSNEVNHGL